MLPSPVPRIIGADHATAGVIITFDDKSAVLFPTALLYEAMMLHKLPRVLETAEKSELDDDNA